MSKAPNGFAHWRLLMKRGEPLFIKSSLHSVPRPRKRVLRHSLGYGARCLGWIHREEISNINKVAFRIFLPCLLYYNVYCSDLSGSFDPLLIAYAVGGVLLSFALALGYTLLLAVISVLLAVIPALLLAFMRLSKNKFVRGISGAYIAIFRSTPLLVQLSIIYFGFFGAISIPRLYIFGFIDISRFIPGVVALALNSSAYVAEIFRAGILAVDAGQTEAARSLGLSATQAMKLVVLPQAIKNVLPALGNEVVTMVKESSICSTLGMVELMFAAKTVATSTYISLAPYVLAALMYFCITYPAGKAIEALERRMRRGDKH